MVQKYHAQKNGEISVDEGEEVVILPRPLSREWYLVRSTRGFGSQGYVPVKYIKENGSNFHDASIPRHPRQPITSSRHSSQPIAEKAPNLTQSSETSRVHQGIYCNGPLCTGLLGINHVCAGPACDAHAYIEGDRYKCAVCHDTDFCARCEASSSNPHNKTHPLIKFRTPVRNVSVTTSGDNEKGPLPPMGDVPGEPLSKNSVERKELPARLSPSPPLQPYPYKPLDFDNYEIRLLKLTWESEEAYPCTFSIVHDSLIDPRPYIALSYCWGDPLSTEKLSADGHEIDITVSLADALRAAEKQYRRKTPIYIWADALCIDQSNNQEKSHQVRSMRQIYSKASRVICWVGNDRASAFHTALDYWLTEVSDHDEERPHSPNSFKEHSRQYVNEFFSQPYWKRVWVIQEITVASKARVSFGDFHMPWEDVARLLSMLREELLQSNRRLEQSFLSAVHLLDFRNLFLSRKPVDLLEAIHMTGQALATDQRDKIFALLGLCHDAHHIVPVPNYKQPLEAIQADMTKVLMTMHRSLDYMCLKGSEHHKVDRPSLPTWSPDWVSLWTRSMTIQEVEFSNWNRLYDFNPLLEGSNNQSLKVKGRMVGKVERLTSLVNPEGGIAIPPPRPSWIQATSTLNQHNERLRNPNQSELEYRDFIWQTLIMSHIPIELTRTCFSSLWKPEGRGLVQNLALISWIDQNAWFKLRRWTMREWSQVTSKYVVRNDQPGIVLQVKRQVSWEAPQKATTEEMMMFVETLDKIIGSGMRLAVLSGGQPLAMVHPEAQERDEIYLLHGCGIPVVLRRSIDIDGGKCYSVVGGAYTLGTDEKSTYYQGTKSSEDLLDWKGKGSEELTLR